MDKIYFDKIFNFHITRATKLHNSSYLEELTGLFEKMASKIDEGTYYYFDNDFYVSHSIFPNNYYNEFVKEFKNTFLNGSSSKIHIIRGKSGIGKTLFFEKGVQKLIRNETPIKDKYVRLGVDFANIDQKQTVLFYTEMIYDTLNKNAKDAIRKLGLDNVFPEFSKQNEKFCCNHFNTPYAMLHPVVYFCNQIYYKYKRPGIIIFDNIDLACVETQNNVFKATAVVCDKLNEFMTSQRHTEQHRVFFAMRPETYSLRGKEAKIGNVINFPLPNVLKISLSTIKAAIWETANKFDSEGTLECEVKFFDIINQRERDVKTFTDVAKYFTEVLDHYLGNLWQNEIIDRLGTTEEFHANIVNCNVRTFLIFLSDTISNGGFKPLTKEFNIKPYESHYTVFDYIEMIIRGRWIVHPGNKFIDGEGRSKAPIIFNIFDTSIWDDTQDKKIKHFMLNIRILQYFSFHYDEEIYFSDLVKLLSMFFDRDCIIDAVKKMLHMRILYSFHEGDLGIASKASWDEVVVNDSDKMSISEAGKFYLEKLICEFEYLYQMALSSLMPSNYTKSLSKCYQFEKERTVLCFLQGIFEILKINISKYNEEELRCFEKLFCQDNITCKPFRRMLKAFILVLLNKVQAAEKKKTGSRENLRNILDEAQKLEQKATAYFSIILGENI